MSPSLGVLGSCTQTIWVLHVPPIQVLSADIALINHPLLLLWVVAHPDFSTLAPFVTLLRILLQFSTCWCKIKQTLFLFAIFSRCLHNWTTCEQIQPLSLTLLWKCLCSDAKNNFFSQGKDPCFNGSFVKIAKPLWIIPLFIYIFYITSYWAVSTRHIFVSLC